MIFCHLLLLLSIFPSIRVFYNESVLPIWWPKYWSFSISPPNKCSALISFKIEWFDLLAVQGTLRSLLQHHSSKASILQHSAFFTVQLSHPHMTTGKTIKLNHGWSNCIMGIVKCSKITADGDCSHEIKRRLLLGRKAMTNLDSELKSRDINLPTKVHLVKAMVFPVVMYRCESWTIKKATC